MNGIVLKIRSMYGSLSKTNKNIADYLFQNLEEFVDLTAIEIGTRSLTSSASVTRFAKAIGLDGLDELKREIIKDINSSNHQKVIDPIISEDDSIDELCDKVEFLVETASNDLFYQLEKDTVKTVVEKMRKAKTIYLVGTGASSLPAYDLYHKLNRINIRTIFDFDSHMILEFLHYAKKGDLLIAFSYSGLSKEVLFPAEIARERGIEVVSITRAKESALRALSDYVISVPNNESTTRVAAISSKYNSLIVADLLYLGVIQPNIKEIESDLVETSNLTKRMKVKEQ